MTAVTIATPASQQQPAPQADIVQRVTGKVRTAIDLMVWQGLPRQQAAQAAGLKDNGLYKALRKSAVRSYYLRELDVLRTSHRARNIHRLAEIRDAANNMPAVQAIGMLERLGAEQQAQHAGQAAIAGFVLVIDRTGQQPSHMPHMQTIEAKPLINHDDGRQVDGKREE